MVVDIEIHCGDATQTKAKTRQPGAVQALHRDGPRGGRGRAGRAFRSGAPNGSQTAQDYSSPEGYHFARGRFLGAVVVKGTSGFAAWNCRPICIRKSRNSITFRSVNSYSVVLIIPSRDNGLGGGMYTVLFCQIAVLRCQA